jgi:outer membrane receptor protein involved in Fe transport
VANQPFNYLYAKPYTIVSAHSSYDLRIGKVRTRLQLNVSNVLDEKDVVYTAFTSNAAAGGDVPNSFRYQTPRKYALTATFNF